MSTQDWITIGTVAAPHGVHGELRVKIETDFPERFTETDQLTFLPPAARGGREQEEERPRAYAVEAARPHRGMFLLTLAGVASREDADRLRGHRVVVRRDEVKPLPEGTWYIFELEGLDVYTTQGVWLGVLTEVLQPGANDVYVVKRDGRETLLPAIKQVIVGVDLERRRMTVNPLEEYEESAPS